MPTLMVWLGWETPAGLDQTLWIQGVSVGGTTIELHYNPEGEHTFKDVIVLKVFEVDLDVEGVAASDEQRDVELKLEYTQAGTTCSDKVKITVVSVDLSATDLDGAVTEQNEEDPGAYVHYNIDNDNGNTQNGNPIADRDEDGPVTDENDLKQASISLQPSLQVGTVVLKRSNIKARVWKTSTKGAANKVLVDANQKTWDLSNQAERNDFNSVKDSLWVEGYWDNGTSSLTVEYKDPDNNLISSDIVKYTFIGAICGRQPTPIERSDFGGEGENPFPNLIHCEWSITAEADDAYNCIAWSVGVTDEWIWWEVDEESGEPNGILEVCDFDVFYGNRGYQLASGLTDATIMLYKSPSAEAPDNPDGITHASRKRSCSCGASRWTMYESKCGKRQRTEHVHDQLNDDTYGAPFRYYKLQ